MPSIGPWPTCCDFISRLVQRDQVAWAEFQPHLILLGRRVAESCRRQFRDDFANDAAAEVFQAIDKYDQSQGTDFFRAWCWKVLKNALISRLRSNTGRRTFCLGEAEWFQLKDTEAQDFASILEFAIDSSSPLSEEDLDFIESIQPTRDRLVVICIGGLVLKVPLSVLTTWLNDCNLDGLFDVQMLLNCESRVDRERYMAGIMRMEPDAVQRVWYRKGPLLKRLKYVQSLRES